MSLKLVPLLLETDEKLMRLRAIKVAFLLSAAFITQGCASDGDLLHEPIKPVLEDDPRLGEEVDTVCFTSGLSGFYEIGNRAIVLRRSVDELYVVRTGYCRTLRHVEGLRITGPGGCLKRGDRLEVYDHPFPRQGERNDRPERCLVMAIHHWRDLPVDAPFYE